MLDFIKKYYIYIGVAIVVAVALVLSMKPEQIQENQIETPNIEHELNNSFIYIDIRGSILNPGVYKVESGTRLFQLIHLAGGFTEDVKENVVNQSILLEDEMYIYIPNIHDEISEIGIDNLNNQSKLVNINTAQKSELESLPGIGPSTAQSIIDYRDNIAQFSAIENIMDVPGIGESTFNEIKDLITV